MKRLLSNMYDFYDFRKNAVYALTIYLITSFIYSDFGISSAIGLLIFLLYMILEIIQFFSIDNESIKNLFKNKCWYPLFVIIVAIYISSLNNFVWDLSKIYYLVVSFISIIISLFAKKITEEIFLNISKIFICFGVFVASLIYLFNFFPKIYMDFVFPILTKSSQDYILLTTSQGYSVSISAEISYTILMIIFSFLFLLFSKNKIFSKSFFKLAFLVYFYFAIFLSQRRTELIFGTMVFLIGMFIIYYSQLKTIICQNKKLIFCILVIIFISILSFLLYLYLLPKDYQSTSRLVQTFLDFKNGKDFSNGRFSLYHLAITIFKDTPLFGVGWMNFSNFAYLTGNIHARNVHCIYLQLFVENGVILGTLILGGFITYIVQIFKKLKNNSRIMISFCIQLYCLLSGLIENTIFYPCFWLFYMMSLLFVFYNKNKTFL